MVLKLLLVWKALFLVKQDYMQPQMFAARRDYAGSASDPCCAAHILCPRLPLLLHLSSSDFDSRFLRLHWRSDCGLSYGGSACACSVGRCIHRSACRAGVPDSEKGTLQLQRELRA